MQAVLGGLLSSLMPTISETIGNVGKQALQTIGQIGSNKLNQLKDKPYQQFQTRLQKVENKVTGIEEEIQEIKQNFNPKFYEKQ